MESKNRSLTVELILDIKIVEPEEVEEGEEGLEKSRSFLEVHMEELDMMETCNSVNMMELRHLQTSDQGNLKRVDVADLEVKKLLVEAFKVNGVIEEANLEKVEDKSKVAFLNTENEKLKKEVHLSSPRS
ncbi:Hypothetical predicted protein [Olea europaea subsp. europaea]|uniref:Uncharacterized protein n=1 Tax=Olea europaea subsp. europaea TaxID=158383 RepID=A0A8S0VEA8_OLEEU|nr:Hypothetical predicted protein [Olea europaea subsp. europaea]